MRWNFPTSDTSALTTQYRKRLTDKYLIIYHSSSSVTVRSGYFQIGKDAQETHAYSLIHTLRFIVLPPLITVHCTLQFRKVFYVHGIQYKQLYMPDQTEIFILYFGKPTIGLYKVKGKVPFSSKQ